MQRIDLLVTDIGLPDLNGRQLADAAREKRPDLKVLFMTGYAEKAARRSRSWRRVWKSSASLSTMDILATKVREMIRKPAARLDAASHALRAGTTSHFPVQ